jgi:RNA polymerase sigma factor (TIGR02999 family)
LNPDSSNPQDHQDLLTMVYTELRRLAASRMANQAPGHTLQPTALVHEAWLRLHDTDHARWNNREHFFRAAAIAMRQILVDHARSKGRLKRHSLQGDFPEEIAASQNPESDILLINECLDRLEVSHPECARVVQLKFFAGLSNQETAELLGISLRSLERMWAFARATLFQMIQARRELGNR